MKISCINPLRFLLIFLFASLTAATAQISTPGVPASFSKNLSAESVPVFKIQAPDTEQLLREDAFTDKLGIAMRFAQNQPTQIDLAKDGLWQQLDDGSQICRLAITSADAQALILYYSNFEIPARAQLFLYDKLHRQIAGAFTSTNNSNGGSFATQMIYGSTTILEYYQPAGNSEHPNMIIDEVGYVYRTAETMYGTRGFGGSGFCEVNVACPEGEQWQQQAKGVARIIVKQGTSSVWCSGSLLNNTLLDHTPWLLTADHCGPNATQSDLDQWMFYFKYQSPDCENPTSDSTFRFYTMTGATKVASAGGSGVKSDFKLLLLNETIPDEYEPFYNGWSAEETPSTHGVTIHHPQGDIKKISTYTQPLISDNWGSYPGTHWRVYWAQTQTNWGVTEGGSSGSPLFNPDGLIVGQLTGGTASCIQASSPDYYGKFSYSWDMGDTLPENQLKHWLDPNNMGVLALQGMTDITEKEIIEKNFTLFPNPSNGIVFIKLNQQSNAPVEIEVMDIAGRVVYRSVENSSSIKIAELDLRHLEHGIYFVKVSQGQRNVSVGKVVLSEVR
ncbi:MAG TPA: T9SS type A sorting domain-containing protein [Bacteroidales bacterium]|nr:T9SS type A sorting domain-containing protein [Bacteroidales bacterium]